ncbi:MAG: GGDEF domain-containing protein [Burkholderiaceae bacterium]
MARLETAGQEWADTWALDTWAESDPSADRSVHKRFLRAMVLRFGRWKACVVVTVIGILASLAMSLVINLLIHRSSHELWVSLLMSAGIPALIAPPVTWLVISLLQDAERARRAAEWLSVTDPLTGAFNRRHFFVVGERRFAHALAAHEPVCVLLLDVDNFKAINDAHGHAAGDRVLIEVARACKASLRDADLLARYGGEEFVALLPATDLAQAMLVAERVRASVAESYVVTDAGAAVQPTVSVGVALRAGALRSFDGLLAQADSAMYEAKRGGKNRVGASPSVQAQPAVAAAG